MNIIDNHFGHQDESCVDESPESTSSSGVASVMQRQNQEVSKFQKPVNPSGKLRGIRGINNMMTNLNLMPVLSIRPAVDFSEQDAQRVATALVMEINSLAGQLFELLTNFNKMLVYKPRRVYKFLSAEYQNRIERSYGENILRHVVLTQDFCFPSEDFTGQLNDVVAKKTREVIKMHQELNGKDPAPVEELNVVADEQGKKTRRHKNMHKYAPLIFEECFVRHQGEMRMANAFEIE